MGAGLGLLLFLCVQAQAEEQWKLFHEDASGNRSFIDEKSLQRPPDGMVSVWMKFVSAKSGQPMMFHDEIDCAKKMIRRKEVVLRNATCFGGEVPEHRSTFEGKWDKISTGLEERLVEEVCGEK